MPPVLLACGTCFEAFQLAPLQRALDAAGIAYELALFGGEHEAADARELGARVDRSYGPGNDEPEREARLTADLLRRPWRCVATIGTGSFAMTLGAAAWQAGVAVVRLDAGVRVHPGGSPTNSRGRGTLAFATCFCVASEWERRELLREGRDAAEVHVTGSLLARALADLPPRGGEPLDVWLALEHSMILDPREYLEEWLLLYIAEIPAVVHAASGRLDRAAHAHGIALPPNLVLVPAGAGAQRDAALAARVIVTDSVGYQRFAVAAGIPCVLDGRELWTPGVAAGLVTVGDSANPLEECVRRMLARGRSAPAPAGDPAGRVLAVLAALPSQAATPPATTALPSDGDASGRTFGEDEVALVSEVIRRGTLNSTRGTFVTTFEQRFAQWLGRKHTIACASGSAAVHCAIAALQLQPGDEVITTPITDMGALTPILYEGAVPVFADVEPVSLNVTAASIRAQLTERTRAIVVTHLFGLPCDMAPILALAQQRGIPVLEDAAQAFGATIGERKAGTFGALAAFSLQQGKHITTGEGGIVATDDDALARRVFLFVNKAWGYGDPKPDHYFPALNYRLTELQGAVAVAQLPKLDDVVARRRGVAQALRDALAGVPGLRLPQDPPHGTHSYWKFAFQVDAAVIPGGAVTLGKRMQAAGIACVPRYIQKPAFECELFADWRKSPVTWLPLQHNPRRERAAAMFARGHYPGAVKALDDVIVLPINERYLPAHFELVAGAIRAAVQELTRA